jgi:translocation and assembly module TamA
LHTPLRRLFALILVATALLADSAVAADPPEQAATPGASGDPAYRVVIAAPSPLDAAIERSVGIVRWRTYADMTADLLDRLAAEARDETRNIAAAEGYFSAVIDIAVDHGAKPPVVTITVTAGEPTRITKVAFDVTGPATTDSPLGTGAIAKARADWGLPVGDVFRQSAWTNAKGSALATLRASPYAAAKIVHSEAAIDPAARAAALTVDIDSGPAFRFGDIVIAGLVKYPESIVRNYSPVKKGDPYAVAALDQFVRRLNTSGYFSSVQAAIDPDTTHPDDATLNVNVIEAPTKTFEGGLGYSTDVRYTAKLNYRDVNIDGRGLQMLVDGQYDGNIQGAGMRLIQPANADGWIGTWRVGARFTDIEGLVTQTASVGTRWYTLEERRERAVSATYYIDNQDPDDAPSSRSHALYLEAEQYLREVDTLVAPTRGWMASFQGGGGIPGVSTRGFGRAIARYAAWIPLDSVSQINLRGDIGAVFASSRDGIPSTLLFRTGGDTTVRGYAFESLGVQQGGAVVGGRYYAVGSVEAIRWIGESWGLAAFVDAGNATDSVSHFDPAVGYGVGVRVRTPLGPFRIDLAYGQQVHEFRLHFSVGLSF